MVKLGQKVRKQLLAGILIFSMTLSCAVTGKAYSADTKILSAVTTPSGDYALVGIRGDYVTESQKALDTINAIRLEACREGVANPNNPSQKLTEEDYVPIQWSVGLEMVARIRAAEASFVLGHTRPNGNSCFSINVNAPLSYYAEDLAWNYSSSMLSGIEQWYAEKADWVNQDQNAVTGHYTSMINPINNYVGLGCMLTAYGSYPNTTCGRFASCSSSLDTTMLEPVTDCIQPIEVRKEDLTNVALTKVTSSSGSSLQVGDAVSYELTVGSLTAGSRARALIMDNVRWTSSNKKIATVDAYGTVTGIGKGTVKITAVSDTGWTADATITVIAKADKGDNGNNGGSGGENGGKSDKKTVTPPAVSKVKSLKVKAGPKKLTIAWKKVSGAAGYQLQVSTKSSFKSAKTVNINRSKKKYVAKQLKAKKKYYVRIRAYKTYKDGNGKTKKAYGTWAKVSKKTK